MAKAPAPTPTHYKLTVNRPFQSSGIMFKPDGRYTVTAAVHDAIRETAPDAIASADPLYME